MGNFDAAYLNFESTPLRFDIVSDESADLTAEATEHPVEDGSDITDNIRDKADEITLNVFVSNTPIADVNGLYGATYATVPLDIPSLDRPVYPTPGSLENAAIGAIGSAISTLLNGTPPPIAATVLTFPVKFNAVKDILDILSDWKSRGVLGEVITASRTYESMAITHIGYKRDTTTGDGATFTIDLKEIRIATAKLVNAPIPTEIRGKLMKNKGAQPTIEIPDGPKKSLALKLAQDAAIKLKGGDPFFGGGI